MINTDIYGAPSTWTTARYMAGAKYANFGTVAAPKNTLLEGSTTGKTPTGKLLENSICTQALGKESLYSNVLWVHDYGDGVQYVKDEQPQTPFFYAECISADGNAQEQESSINLNYNTNSWKPYVTDDTYENKSAASRPIAEYDPKKTVYVLRIIAENEGHTNTQTAIIGNYIQYPQFRQNYPYLKAAFLSPYVDTSSTDTPTREEINYNALFGICPNYEINANTENIKINYAFWRSCLYNVIPIWGIFGSFNRFDRRYTGALCEPEDLVIEDNTVEARKRITDELLEYLIKQAACFGVYVKTGTAGDIANVALDHNSIILGLLDSDGVGHGEYTRGAANRTNPIWDWETNRDSPFDPYKVPDPTRYDTTTVFGSNSLYNTFIQYYACSPDGLKTLCNYIYNYINDINTSTDDITKSIVKTFYTNNPLDVVVSLKRFPFNITNYFSSGSIAPVNIRLGELVTSGYGWALSGQYTVVDFGSYDCYPYFDNTFLDYAPYTYYELIIPFCGSTRLDPAVFMGHKLRLKMVVDLYTGACTCYILADSLCIDSVSGNCAIDIPITGIQSADFQNSVQNAITNVKNARINTAAYNMRGNLAMSPVWTGQIGGNALFKGGAAARIGNAISGLTTSVSSALHFGGNAASAQKEEAENYIANQKAEYDLQHVQTPFASVGSQSAANSYVEEMQARLIIYRPKFAADYNESVYAATEGHACLINGKVRDFTNKGLTIGNVKTYNIVNVAGMSPTAAEQAMLKNAFSTGVIL